LYWPVDRKRFEREVDKVIEGLPEWVIERVDNLVIIVKEQAAPDQDPTGELLGIYEGVSLRDRSGDYWGVGPDQITIFRKPHLAMELSDEDLVDEIRRTVLHEIGHYLGIDDARLHQLGWD
jgi:predicted Zn-dependent protease with MMP-like domain